MSYIKNSCCNYVYVNSRRYLYEFLIACLRKSTSEIGLDVLAFFTFINSFMKEFIQQYDVLNRILIGVPRLEEVGGM